jgi:hypothetical protein
MLRDMRFLAGMLCGVIVTTVAGTAWLQWKPQRSADDTAIYDICLMNRAGNTVVCDAEMRTIDRERIAEAEMKKRVATLLAAGFSKREVVEWALKSGFNGTQVSEAVGISWKDLIDNKY